MERYGYSQVQVTRLLNKSKSDVSRILGLERLSETAKEIVSTSKLPKEIQMEASREKDPEKQIEILQKATEEGKTVREIRHELKEEKAGKPGNGSSEQSSTKIVKNKARNTKTFRKWEWKSDDGICQISVRFGKKHSMIG